MIQRFLVIVFLAVISGCASVAKVETGDRAVGERMNINIEGSWNHIDAPGIGPAQVWTMEGMPVDQLLLYSGIKDGEAIHAGGGGGQKSFEFKASMQPDEVATLFEGMLTRDGSRYKLEKLAPVNLNGTRGFRFEFSMVRKIDNVQLSGIGYGAVSKGELFAMVYMAPRLVFYPRHMGRVEQIGRSIRIKP